MDNLQAVMMGAPSIDTGGRCAICGRWGRTELHHVVPRSQGGTDGPVISLCGAGNGLYDGSGRPFHHGMAHHHMLHFRWDGRSWWYLVTEHPTKYYKTLDMDGWRQIPWSGGTEEIEFSNDVPWLRSVSTPPVHYVWNDGWEPPF